MNARKGVQKWLASANVKVTRINAFNAMADQFQQIGDSRWKLRIDPEKSRRPHPLRHGMYMVGRDRLELPTFCV